MTNKKPKGVNPDAEQPKANGSGNGSAHNAAVKVEENN